ncbi:hypothetical protein LB557_17165 [Mesorhizobium sp. BR115XR7A]|uniref:hypothetical protein n=1 Tax=Mesorhizobium sp. BR115XR7A TaxID=2876645 RepID=UPI001CCEC975|nr:hypothetical protein [Mesorhizobium sp. BR115XR7A]MBZ9907739.1 hypothetical protein [Mesorhizobium sp. BR115XR7A]MBZ9929059.1 hypothetical protein [Mesorhizobium sp. BR1-1-5]
MNWIINYQGILGTLVALFAALIGFGGVIYSQRALATESARQRSHEEARAKSEAEASRRQQLASVINAILGEVQALGLALADASRLLAAQIQIAEAMANQGGDRKTRPRISFRFETPIFNAYVGSIGLLEPEIAFRVANFYGRLMSLGVHNAADAPEMAASLAVRVMRSVEGALSGVQSEAEGLVSMLRKHRDSKN